MAITLDPQITKALQLIARENARTGDRFTDADDDGHTEGELAQAAAVYALLSAGDPKDRQATRPSLSWKPAALLAAWPFDNHPKIQEGNGNLDRIQDLVKAGNLIVSEIARRLRQE